MLVRLLYASRTAKAIDDKLIDAILHCSQENNLVHGITGVLCLDHRTGLFLQVLEGARPAVNRLFTNIMKDPRHDNVLLLMFDEIEERRFPGWRMGSVDLNKINLSTILRFSETSQLDPYAMSGSSALALIEELTNSAAIVGREIR
jgi:hypothetical protein